MNGLNQIDSSTIDGNVEFVHSQYSCILTSQVPNKQNTGFQRDWVDGELVYNSRD